MKTKHIYISLLFSILTNIGIKASTNPITPPSINDYFFKYCDTCGCSGNGGSMGYGTTLNKNFVGIRYISQHYQSKDGIYKNSALIDENFNTIQVWSKLPITKRFLVNAMIPYHFHNRKFVNGKEQTIRGIGDITLMAFYKIIKPKEDTLLLKPKKLNHTLRIGGGVKMPTGEYNLSNNNGSVNPGFQVGTGSWDYTLAIDYSLGSTIWGFNLLANYTFKTKNDDFYHFGDQFNYGMDAYRVFNLNPQLKFTPFGGIAGEIFQENEQFNLPVPNSTGDVLFSKIGLEFSYLRWSLGINTMLPLAQNLNNGMVEVKSRLGAYFNFNI